jgi:VWFA-related protein
MTFNGTRSGAKTTKTTTITTPWVFVFFAVFVVFVAERSPWAVSAQQPAPPQQPTQAQQKPVFRAGTHLVLVDAYPTTKDGHIAEGLTPGDFEVTEDGNPQSIESFDYVSFPTFTPDAERHDPDSQRDGFELARDPRYRVFVIVVDAQLNVNNNNGHGDTRLWNMQKPLTEFLDRLIGPRDLFGFLTTLNTGKDLVLGQKTTAIEAEISNLWQSTLLEHDPEVENLVNRCGSMGGRLVSRFKSDRTYTSLESIVVQLGSLRDERKSVIFVADSISREPPSTPLSQANGASFPRPGIAGGRVTMDRPDSPAEDQYCTGEVKRLAPMDFNERYRDLLKSARTANVAFYPIAPSGIKIPGPSIQGVEAANEATDGLVTLANQTDGVPFVTNDLQNALRRLADDLSGYYLLGYYTTNTKWDGGVRTIKVKLKGSGQTVRARRQYRAPTEAEFASLASRSAPATAAPAQSGPATLIGEPVAYRVALRQAPEKSPRLEFTRSDRLRVEWPVLAPLDRREARVLDSGGKPLPIDVPLSENEPARTVVVELALAPFAHGVYSIELTAGAGAKTERRRLTFTMK